MIITDYLKSEKNIIWDYAKQCGVKYATMRLPDDEKTFDITNFHHWQDIIGRFENFGIKPIQLFPGRVYNVKKNVWHSVIMEEDSKIFVIEDADTGDENTERIYFGGEKL